MYRYTLPVITLLITGCDRSRAYMPNDYQPSEPHRIVFLGDSITDLEESEELYPMYPKLLVDGDAYVTGLRAIFPTLEDAHYLAVGGSTSEDMLTDQLAAVETTLNLPVTGQTIVAITIGGNDLMNAEKTPMVGRRTGRQVATNLEALVDFFEDPTLFPDGAFVYVANVYDPMGEDSRGNVCFSNLESMFMSVAIDNLNIAVARGAKDRGFALLDTFSLFFEHGYGNSDPEATDPTDPTSPHWFADCEHPNAKGHVALRDMFWNAITGLEVPN